VPGLAVIPRISGGSGNGRSRLRGLLGSGKTARPGAGSPMSGGQTFSIGIEAFRNLRTSLIWSDGGEALKTLVVTSAAPGEGKTLTAANLAVTLAYDGLRVLPGIEVAPGEQPQPDGMRHVVPHLRHEQFAPDDPRIERRTSVQEIRHVRTLGLRYELAIPPRSEQPSLFQRCAHPAFVEQHRRLPVP